MIHWWEKWSDDEKADIFAHFMHEFPSNITPSDLKTQAFRNPPDFKKPLLAIDIAESLKNRSLIFEDVFPLCTWLNSVSPLPSVISWDMSLWEQLLEKVNYASVFVPLVSSKGPSPSLLTCCYLKSGSWGKFPKGIESSGNKSVESAFDSMRALEKGVDIRKVRIFADKPMTGSIGSSASLGIALALWCASRKIDDASELSRLLALKYLVTGHLLPDGSVKKIKNLCLKEKLVRERRSLIAPYGNRQEGISFLGVNTWDDAKARISPDHIIPVDSDEFPDCDVLIGVASKQTEPHLQLIDILKPRKKIIFLHSVDEDESLKPAKRLERCIEENRSTGRLRKLKADVELAIIDVLRPDIAANDICSLITRLTEDEKIDESKIVINLTGGNKLSAIAMTIACRGKLCPIIYRERDGEYTIFSFDKSNSLRPAKFINEPAWVLSDWDKDSVATCVAKEIKSGK